MGGRPRVAACLACGLLRNSEMSSPPGDRRRSEKIAHRYLRRGNQPIILRMHYGQGSYDKTATILEDEEDSDESIDPGDNWRRVLDEAGLSDFGGEWERILDVLPEPVGQRGQ